MTFSIENFDFFFLILVRITGFIFTAPFFSLKNIPIKVKTGLAVFLSAVLFYTVPYTPPVYSTIIEYSIIVVTEALAGAIMGFFANIVYYILAFSGQFLDMHIGFSMVNELDPLTNTQTTITANLYGYMIMLMMMITNMHHYFLKAVIDSFRVINIGKVNISPNLSQLMLQFITDYFIIGFRIVLPVFASILLVDTILAILAKVAPQINMFVLGVQIKIIVGLLVLAFIITLVPSVADAIFNEMILMLKGSIALLK